MSTQTDTPTDAPFDYCATGDCEPTDTDRQLARELAEHDSVSSVTWVAPVGEVSVRTDDAHALLAHAGDCSKHLIKSARHFENSGKAEIYFSAL